MAAPQEAEYKQVTVLFADVVRSMDLAASVGAERLREIMGDVFDRCSRVVRHYGGTLDKFTGDGVMAVFGAPIALEDHAFRACLAAIDIQREADGLREQIRARDGVALALRVGLDSGQVITGGVGSDSPIYTAIGEHVGLAQRMESAAPPGGVMLSAATAGLVRDCAELGDPETVVLKGSGIRVPARRLLAVGARTAQIDDTDMVGRRWERAAVEALLQRVTGGQGSVVHVVGPPGIGKSRLVRAVLQDAARLGMEIHSVYCESHASDISFHVIRQLLRTGTGVSGVEPGTARAILDELTPGADPQDRLLLQELLGVAESDADIPPIDPDARRRRLTALINAVSLSRTTPALYVIEDVHWIDRISESLLADFLSVVPRVPSMVLITSRPQYRGTLNAIPVAQTFALMPLSEPESSALVTGLLGPAAADRELCSAIVEQGGGNPFFLREMVRDLQERGALRGERGDYTVIRGRHELTVPATLQATIAARIDRLQPGAKRTLCAAAVAGSVFEARTLHGLGIEPQIDELVAAELVDQIRFTPRPLYAFHQPLIRAVAYESQLKSDRAILHRRLAELVQTLDPAAVDGNAALIAEHLERAGEWEDAYDWHMRAGAWLTTRDISAAQVSWERARRIADELPADAPDTLTKRIAPRTMLCGSGFRTGLEVSGERFDELRELCEQAGDKASLAVAMSGVLGEHFMKGRAREAIEMTPELSALIESSGDPTLMMQLSVGPIAIRMTAGDLAEALRWAQMVIEVADDTEFSGAGLFVGAPLASAYASRAFGRAAAGEHGWRVDADRAVAMVNETDSMSLGIVIVYAFAMPIAHGILQPDAGVRRQLESVLQFAERSADDLGLGFARMGFGVALLHGDRPDADAAMTLLRQTRQMCVDGRFYQAHLPILDSWIGRGMTLRGDRDGAVPVLRAAWNALRAEGQHGHTAPTARLFVETLLNGGDADEIAEAEETIGVLAAETALDGWRTRDTTVLRLRALLAHVRGDNATYAHLRDRYRTLAVDSGYEADVALAQQMS
ncbi:adenylate/guanylate cyclase domain-containing protein [Mycobacterium sp. IS-1496]|uniref:ATP-binding protein n=1 Tax=Mycobacterium sp. IS-1496 TaxID=1772284 RepID=UPI00336A5ED2